MDLTADLLVGAYCQGIFPMADPEGTVRWFDPDPRAILPLDQFHVSHSLQRAIRQRRYEITVNRDFSAVMRACASAPGRHETWISPAFIRAYEELHALGFAHSVEAWHDGRLAGGLYGVAINGLFAGESMFSLERDASKLALVYLVERLCSRDFQLLDVQFMTEHLRSFGAIEIRRRDYKRLLHSALRAPVHFLGEGEVG
jgi:leucyl/phenylalanyl-tRNA--protein transferase